MSNLHKFQVGAKLRVIRAFGTPFAVGADVTVTAQIANRYGNVRYAINGNDGSGSGWDENRFEPVRKAADKDTAPGSTVICVDSGRCAEQYLTQGRIYTVRAQGGYGLILEGVEHPYDEWNYSRFEVVTEPAPTPAPVPAEPVRKFNAGDTVRSLRRIYYPSVNAGDIRVVSGYNALGNLTIEGTGESGYYQDDFELVPQEPAAPTREFKAGDKVRARLSTLDITKGFVYTVLKNDHGFVRVTDDAGDDNGMLRITDYELVEAAPAAVYKVLAQLPDATPWGAEFDSIEAAEQAITASGRADVTFDIFSEVRTIHRSVKLVETTMRELVNV